MFVFSLAARRLTRPFAAGAAVDTLLAVN